VNAMDSFVPTMLVLLLVIPVAAAVVAAALGPDRRAAVRTVSLGAVIINLVLTFLILIPAVPNLQSRVDGAATFQPIYSTVIDLLPLNSDGPAAIQFFIGLDGLNIWLVALTSFLMLPSVLIGWESIKERANEYYAWLLLLQTAMTGVFLSFDLVLFYVFFELTLVPLFFLIGIWGGSMRREASRKFFLYTLAGSLITLLGAIAVVLICQQHGGKVGGSGLTFSIPELVRTVQGFLGGGHAESFYGLHVQTLIFLALALGFAIKVPLFPLHTWLPLAHTEAPTAGSVLLAGVLLKLGTYGFLRLCLPLTPDAALTVGVPLIGTLAAIGVIYGALCAYAQTDIKKLVAYSSVSHLGFCMLGLFALNAAGVSGGLLQMINHGLSTGGLFLIVGMLYDRYHTRQMADYSGMAARLKLLSAFMVFICLTSVGMPGLNGFVGEMLILAGVYDLRLTSVNGAGFAVVLAVGIVLGAWYLFTMLMRVFFGPLREPQHEGHAVSDLDGRELATIVPVMGLCLLLGVWPQPVLDAARADVGIVVRIADQAKRRATTTTERSAATASAPGSPTPAR
jgi:NADH-quinone oxidoreductase subunit M